MKVVKHISVLLFLTVVSVAAADAQQVARDIPYATAHARQVLDVYAPAGAKSLPVVFWIHGGGWQTGDKSMVALKPKAFMEAGTYLDPAATFPGGSVLVGSRAKGRESWVNEATASSRLERPLPYQRIPKC